MSTHREGSGGSGSKVLRRTRRRFRRRIARFRDQTQWSYDRNRRAFKSRYRRMKKRFA